jgi:hypothetical protein
MVGWHCPALQLPPRQLCPHVPQFNGSLLLLTHVPPQVSGLPVGQTHCAPEQLAPTGDVHALPHIPQLPLSLFVLTHLPEQQVWPPPHAGPPPQVHALFVHPSEVDAEQVFGQVTPLPQLSVAGPHALPLHVVESG